MASLESRTGYYNIVFRFRGKKGTLSLCVKKTEAQSRCERLEENIRLVESGRLNSLMVSTGSPARVLKDCSGYLKKALETN